MPDAGPRFVDLPAGGQRLRLEYRWLGDRHDPGPCVVFLHEGLGSVSMWRDFPARLCQAAGCRGLVFSRAGYGRSLPAAREAPWRPDYMHREATEVLPAVLAALLPAPVEPPVLVGHSDGGSIALIHASRFPDRVAGLAVLAPHIKVEPLSVTSIAAAGDAFRTTDLPQRLARHHDDADGAFWRWHDIWLSPAFRDWSIEDDLPAIRCPVLAIQGLDDAYGTMAQVHGIVERIPGARLLELADCGHSPHRDQPEATVVAVAGLVRELGARAPRLPNGPAGP